MPDYIYKALTGAGEVVKGEAYADSLDDLKQIMETRGYLVQNAHCKVHVFGQRTRFRIKPELFQLFNQELIALLKSGVSITVTLSELSDRPDQPYLSSILKEIFSHVSAGDSFSVACRRFPTVFEPLYISALETGESAGDLVPPLKRYQKQLENRILMQRQVKQALLYPLFLLVLLVFVLIILFTFVLPRFVDLYADFDSELPLATQWLIRAVETSPVWFGLIVMVVSISIIIFKTSENTNRRLLLDKYLLKIPLIGTILNLQIKAQMCRTMATLLGSGMPIVDAMQKTAGVLSNQYFAKRFQLAANGVSSGQAFSSSLLKDDLISGSSYTIIKTGESAGNLVNMLDEVAEFSEQLLRYRLARLTGLLEPLLMLLVGVVVGGIILITYLPIFSMADVIR